MRAHPSDKSEMVSQLLYGETYSILDHQIKWVLIRTTFDQYEGWISINQLHLFDKAFNDSPSQSIVTSLYGTLIQPENHIQILSFGSNFSVTTTDKITDPNQIDSFTGKFHEIKTFNKDLVLQFSCMWIGVPYLWGGRSIFGVDCSGFTQLIFKAAGYTLFRDASLQVNQGEIVNFIQEAQPGDLAFFDNEEGGIVHVGIITDNKNVIHASGSVRIDQIDHQGIFNEQERKYTHHLRVIKRI